MSLEGFNYSRGRRSSSGFKYTPRDEFTGSVTSRVTKYRAEKAKNSSGSKGKIGPKENVAQSVVVLLSSDKKAHREEGYRILRENLDAITPGLRKEYFAKDRYRDALARAEKDASGRERKGVLGAIFGHDKKRSLFSQAMHAPAKVARAAKVPEVVEILGRPQHATMEAIQAVQEEIRGPQGLSDIASKGLREEVKKKSGWGDVLSALAGGETYDTTTLRKGHSLDYANALGVDLDTEAKSGWLRNIGKAASFTGGAALDPVNLVGGLGTATEAAKGTRALAEVVATDAAKKAGKETATDLAIADAERRIAKLGARKATTAEQRKAAIALLKDENAAAGVTEKGLRIAPKSEDKAAKRFVDAAVSRDRGGLRVAGRSVVPEGVRSPVRGFLKDTVTPFTEEQRIAQVLGRASDEAGTLTKRIDRSQQTATAARQRIAELTGKADLADDEIADLARARKTLSRAEGRLRVNTEKRQTLLDALKTEDPAEVIAVRPDLARVAENVTSVERGAVSKVLDRTGLRSVTEWGKEHLSPYSQVRNSLSLDGEQTVGKLRDLRGKTRAAMIQHDEMVTNSIMRAQKEVGRLSEEEVTVIRDALDRGGNFDTVVKDLDAAGKTKQADYLRHLDSIRRADNAVMLEKGLLSENSLIPIDEYLGRIFTPRGRRAVRLAEKRKAELLAKHGVTTQASVTAKQGGHTLARAIDPELPVTQIEKTLGADLRAQGLLERRLLPGGRHGDRLYEMSPGVATATRSRQIAAAAAQADFIDGAAREIRGTFGEELVRRIHPGMSEEAAAASRKAAEKSGLTKIDLGPAGEVWAHPDLAPEIANVTRLTGSADGVREIGRMWDAWNRTWAAYATTPLITGTSFPMRNAQGNVFLAVLGGLKNPLKFAEASKLQNAAMLATRRFPDLPFDEALSKFAEDGGFLRLGLKDESRARLIAAAENGVVKEGFSHHDLGEQAASMLHEAGSKNPLRKVFKASSVSDNPVTRSGRAFNAAIEDNARLAVFLDQLDKTGDIASSVAHVKKYLFDYSELTPFEARYIKRVNKFYTFARKATPLVFKELADNPSRFVQAARAEEAALGQQDLAPGEVQPSYLEDGSQGRKSSFLTGLLGMDKEGGFAVAGFDTPLTSAQKTVQPISDLLAGDGTLAARDALSLTAGGPVEFTKFVFEKASGSSAFTGGSLTDKYGRNKKSDAVRLISTLFPVASKGEGLRKQGLTDVLPGGKDPDAKAKAAALKAILGVNTTLVTGEQQDVIKKSEMYKLKELLEMLREKDPDIPTIGELRRVGILPETESKKSKSSGSSKYDFSSFGN